MSLQGPEKQRPATKEVPPEPFPVAVPQLLAKYPAAHGPPEKPPHNHVYRVVQPHQHSSPRPYHATYHRVVAISDPCVALQRLSQPFSEHLVGRLSPVRAVSIRVELHVRLGERLSNLPGDRRLARAGGADYDDAISIRASQPSPPWVRLWTRPALSQKAISISLD